MEKNTKGRAKAKEPMDAALPLGTPPAEWPYQSTKPLSSHGASAWAAFVASASPTQTAKAQSLSVRRCAADLSACPPPDRTAGDIAAHAHMCRAVVGAVLRTVAPSPPNGVLCTAVAQLVSAVPFAESPELADAISAEVASFVAASPSIPCSTLVAALDIAPLSRFLAPHSAAVLSSLVSQLAACRVQLEGERDSVPGVRFDGRLCSGAAKAFVGFSARFPAEVADAIRARDDKASPVAATAMLLMTDLRRSKEFMAASGIALANVLAARSIRQPGIDSDAIAAETAFSPTSEAPQSKSRPGVVLVSQDEVRLFRALPEAAVVSTLSGFVTSKFCSTVAPSLSEAPFLFGVLIPRTVDACERASEQTPLFTTIKSLQILLSRARDVLSRGGAGAGLGADASAPIESLLLGRVMDLVWKHQVAPADAIKDIVSMTFACVLDIAALLPGGIEGGVVQKLTAKLLSVSWHSKGKYAPLMCLLERIPASAPKLLARQDVFDGLLDAMADRSVHSSATAFFCALLKASGSVGVKEFAERLSGALLSRAESFGVDGSWRTLVEDSTSAVLSVLPGSLGLLVSAFGVPRGPEASPARLACLLCVINFARKSSIATLDGISKLVPVEAVIAAGLSHPDDPVFIEALELVCTSPKPSDPLTELELRAARWFLVSNSAHSSMNSRQRMIAPLTRLFERLRNALSRNVMSRAAKAKAADPFAAAAAAAMLATPQGPSNQELLEFANWAGDHLIALMYPGGSQERTMFALAAYRVFEGIFRGSAVDGVRSVGSSPAHAGTVFSCLWRTMDKTRITAHEILSSSEGPLAGLDDNESVAAALRWGLRLAHSPRMHRSDAGGRVLSIAMARLLSGAPRRATFAVSASVGDNVTVSVSVEAAEARPMVAVCEEFVGQLLKVLRAHVEAAKANLLLASQRSPMHGILAAIRYCTEFVQFEAIAGTPGEPGWRTLLADVVAVAEGSHAAVLHVVADLAPEGYDPKVSGGASMIEAIPQPPQEPMSSLGMDVDGEGFDADGVNAGDEGEEEEEEGGVRGPEGQMMSVCSWLCIKEASYLIGSICNRARQLVSVEQVRSAGDMFVKLLLSTRHKGAIEKAYEGFRVLCSAAVTSNDPEVRRIPAEWAQRTLDALCGPIAEQVTRRSAGIPFCLSAIVSSELSAQHSSCRILDMTMARMLDLSTGKSGFAPQVHSFNIVSSFVNQKAIAAHIDPYLDRILVRILEAYTSPDWSVRNAATIAFNLVIKKRVSSTPFYEFFIRFPNLYGYTLEHIGAMCSSASGDLLQSSLFAVLTLLARLLPSSSETADSPEEAAGARSPRPFVPHVLSCASQRTFQIRETAASALLSLVDQSEAAALCLRIASELPDSPEQPSFSANAVHGKLLQLWRLIGRCRAPVSHELCDVVERKAWLAASPCAPIGIAAIRCIAALLRIAPAEALSLRKEGTRAVRAGLEVALSSECKMPMDTVRAELAAETCLDEAHRDGSEYAEAAGETAGALLDRVLCAPEHLYEVRIAGLRYVKDRALPCDVLRARMTEMLLHDERFQRCQKRLLQAFPRHFAQLPWKPADCADGGQLSLLWDFGERALGEGSLCKAAIAFLGFLTGVWPTGRPSRWDAMSKAIAAFGDSSSVVTRRLALAEGLRLALSSKVLAQDVAHDVWGSLVQLLQDDDVFVRQAAGSTVSTALKLEHLVSPAIALQHAVRMFESLASGVPAAPAPAAASALAGAPRAGDGGALFEVEPENFFIEDAVMAQLLHSGTADVATAMSQLSAVLSDVSASVTLAQQKGAGWPRWAMFEKDVFSKVYSACLQLHKVTSVCGFVPDDSHARSLEGILSLLKAVPCHPLVAQLLHSVAESVLGSADESLCQLPLADAARFLVPGDARLAVAQVRHVEVIVRHRAARNTFTWGPLVRVLVDAGYHVAVFKKKPHAAKAMFGSVAPVAAAPSARLYLDSFMTIDAGVASEEAGVMRSALTSPGVPVFTAAGGAHPTAVPRGTLDLGFDIAVRGEGEVAVLAIADAVERAVVSGSPVDWSGVPNAVFRGRSGEVVETEKGPLLRLDDYLPYCDSPTLHPPFEIMRGCNFGCLYCHTPRLVGHVRYRSLQSVEAIVAAYSTRFPAPLDLRIIAPNALAYQSPDGRHANIDALRGLIAIARKYNARLFLGSFPSEVRPDFVTEETVQILLECDSPVVAVGAQAGSDSELRRMGRGHTVQQTRHAVELLRAAGLVPYVDFILCCPGETDEEQCATATFINELLGMGCHIRLHHFMPLPGTPWATLPPTELSKAVMPLLNPLLGDSRVEGAFTRQKEGATANDATKK